MEYTDHPVELTPHAQNSLSSGGYVIPHAASPWLLRVHVPHLPEKALRYAVHATIATPLRYVYWPHIGI